MEIQDRRKIWAVGPLSPAALEGHGLSLAIGGNWSDRVGLVVRVRLEAGLPTLVDRLLLRQLLNTWLWDGSPSGICPQVHSVWIATGTGGAWSPILLLPSNCPNVVVSELVQWLSSSPGSVQWLSRSPGLVQEFKPFLNKFFFALPEFCFYVFVFHNF